MENVFDFIRAAAPWVAMGLLLAIFAVRSAAKKKKDQEQEVDYGTEGMCLGMCFGTAVSATSGNNVAIGLSLGMMTGFAIGSSMRKERQNNKK